MCKGMYLHTHGCTQHVNARVYKSEWECMHTHVYPFFFLEMAARVYMVYMPVIWLLMYVLRVHVCPCLPVWTCMCMHVQTTSGIELFINMHVSIFMCPHMHEGTFVDSVVIGGGDSQFVCWLIWFVTNGGKLSGRVWRFLTWGPPLHTVAPVSAKTAEITEIS